MKRSSVVVAAAVVAIAALVLAGCAERKPAKSSPGAATAAGIPEERIGLAEGRLADLPPLAAVPAKPGDPGEAPAGPPAYPGSPPVVPHAVDDYVPIGREDNACLGCHLVEDAVEGEPTPLPASHFDDLRDAPGVRGEAVVGARWVCVSCHVAPTDAAPLVQNAF